MAKIVIFRPCISSFLPSELMKLSKNFALAIITIIAILCFNLISIAHSPQPTIQLITEPTQGKLLPFEAEASKPQLPTSLTLKALDETGKPLANAKIHLTILTPPKNPWLPTDFPFVEGTKLLDIETITPNGELQIQQIFPIRGKYQLMVDVAPSTANKFKPFQQILTLSISENPIKLINFGILAVILLLVGLGGGWVIGGKQQIQPGEIAPVRVRLLLSGVTVVAIIALLFVNISAEISESEAHEHHHSHAASSATPNTEIIDSSGIKLQITGDSDTHIGQLANFQIAAIDTKKNQPVTDLNFEIKSRQLEDKWVAFAYQGTTDKTGKFAWQQQFFDGAPHQIEVNFYPKNNAKPLSLPLTKSIAVEGSAPPLPARLISLTYLTSIIALGLIFGIQIRQRTAEKLN